MIDFSTLFQAVGKLGKTYNDLSAVEGTDVPSDIADIFAQYTPTYPNLVPTLQNDSNNLLTIYDSFKGGDLTTITQNSIIYFVNLDVPQPNLTLNLALQELNTQMVANAQSFLQNTVGDTVTALSTNIGVGNVVISFLDAFGLQFETPFNEGATLTCTNDSFTGTATAGNETFLWQGAFPTAATTAWNYPLGSGSSLSFNAVDALDNNVSSSSVLGQLLTNGSFENWTALLPNSWTAVSGAGGTEIIEENSVVYVGSHAVDLVGTGTDPVLQQIFNNSGSGTGAFLTPLTPISGNFWARADASLGSGTLTIELYDITNSAVMNDDQGNPNSIVINLTSLSNTTYQPFSFTFRTPRQLPAAYGIRIIGSSIPMANNVYIDQFALTSVSQPYPGAGLIAIFSGNTNYVLNDGYTAAITNDYASVWQTYLERTTSLASQGIIFPASNSPTILEAWIT